MQRQSTASLTYSLTVSMLSFVPLTLLACDFFANRIYLPITIVVNYSIFAYTLAIGYSLIRAEMEEMYRLPELRYFELQRHGLAWALPIMITAGVYLVTRFKFWYLGEGDLVFDFDKWAKEASDRMENLENEGAKEEAFFHF